MRVLLGWDVAQTTDSSIIAVLEYDGNPAMYWVRRIVKLAKGMPYDQQVKAVRELFFQYQSPRLIIDRTGVGLPICDMIVAGGLQPIQVSLTAGDVMNKPEPGKVNLPKKDMVASITKVIQERRIKVARGCENAPLFRRELKAFQLKVSASGHNTYNAGPGSHDDTITAVGLCLWHGDKGGRNFANEPTIEDAVGGNSYYQDDDDFGLGSGDVRDLFGDDPVRINPENFHIPGRMFPG